ncbi:hypothetical protein J5N97_018432 [Dioscorea zingiberensis]|uniref:ABC transporter domain-containing protein n=1 Tax=Dioscorea zingiberensis TaxID=325984 RepID=A0A9D5CQ80_9LILI|nr:hypothetical protein J5N97_018432 [Dioscorea zingiberensis]
MRPKGFSQGFLGQQVRGEVSYNGYKLEEFVPGKTASYIRQNDLHIPQMTVRETLDFSARFQGVGNREEILKEVIRREKQTGIIPEPEIDTYMKAISVNGVERSIQTNYVLKILGLEICADIMVGDAMRRGISGGQKKRLTTGEVIVGPTKALFMDEISTGLDSSTTFQIVTCFQHMAHITEATIFISLLQPAPETYVLFDDIILMTEGKIVYQGPRDQVLAFFEECGFKCPNRKGEADFLQEVLSKMDQNQYWYRPQETYTYVSVDEFCKQFKSFDVGKNLEEQLSKPYGKSQCHKNALSFNQYSLPKWELFRACMARELLLMKRNSFLYIFKICQFSIVASISMSVFLRSDMRLDVEHANYYTGSLFFTLVLNMVNGLPEIAMTVSRLPCFYKQRDVHFYPAWAYAIPATISKVPISLIESLIWTSVTYYGIGYSPEAEMKEQGYMRKKLQLLHNITGAFRPGVLSVLMGVSGAGKTTLLDVLSGRKTGGVIEGDIRIGGYPKAQATFARISGYCEQTDIHSPQITVEESVIYSAWLRLPSDINSKTRSEFVDEVLETIELDGIKDALVGIPGISGLSTEQRKRLTIAVELVANPSILFMDEPTSGLDARAAAIVMRAVKNVAETGRTVVCTIHQPSIDIFEAFDERIPGVPKIKDNYNPAVWMLEVTASSVEAQLGLNFAQIYNGSTLYKNNQQNLFNILGSMFVAALFNGINNCSAVMPFVITERPVLYREKFAGMYSPWAYSLAKVVIEIPYVLILVFLFTIIAYPAIGYYWSAPKFLWFFYAMFCTLLTFVYFGMFVASLCPNVQVASIVSSFSFQNFNLFSGFIIPGPHIPKWWIWFHYITPLSWTLNGLFTSQYGDIQEEITVFGETKPVALFLQDYFGFHHDRLGLVAVLLLVFPSLFASLFSYCIGNLNFQRR